MPLNKKQTKIKQSSEFGQDIEKIHRNNKNILRSTISQNLTADRIMIGDSAKKKSFQHTYMVPVV